jgi:plastocyanin
VSAHRPAPWSWLAAAALLLAACGPASTEPSLVVMVDSATFVPGVITVPAGGTVIWRNADRLVHTVTADAELRTDTYHLAAGLPDGAEPFDSGDVFAGQTWAHTFTAPGQYVYFCRYHANEQMFGTLVVEAAQ